MKDNGVMIMLMGRADFSFEETNIKVSSSLMKQKKPNMYQLTNQRYIKVHLKIINMMVKVN